MFITTSELTLTEVCEPHGNAKHPISVANALMASARSASCAPLVVAVVELRRSSRASHSKVYSFLLFPVSVWGGAAAKKWEMFAEIFRKIQNFDWGEKTLVKA